MRRASARQCAPTRLAPGTRRPFAIACVLALAVAVRVLDPGAEAAARGCFPRPARRRLHPLRLRALARRRATRSSGSPATATRRARPRRSTRVVLAIGLGRRLPRARRSASGPRSSRCSPSRRFVARSGVLARPCPPLARVARRAPARSRSGSSTGRSSAGWRSRVFAAALGRALEALARRARASTSAAGDARGLRSGGSGRGARRSSSSGPRRSSLVAVFAVVAARGAARRSGVARARSAPALPAPLATALVLGANRLATGRCAVRRRAAEAPLVEPVPLRRRSRARLRREPRHVRGEGRARRARRRAAALGVVLPLLALVALASARARPSRPRVPARRARLDAPRLAGTATRRIHNFRYYAPALAPRAGGRGVAARPRRERARPRAEPSSRASLVAGRDRSRAPRGSRRRSSHFRVARARTSAISRSRSARRLARRSRPARACSLGDAGAIPYVSGRAALDALGLGGYRAMPFARAAVHGEAATIELDRAARARASARRTSRSTRTGSALITSRFGVELERVTIADNVICGGPDEGDLPRRLERARRPRTSAGAPRIVDELDVADVIERGASTRYASPVPDGGWTTLDVLADAAGARRFDGGRIIPGGATRVVRRSVRGPPAMVPLRIVVRVDSAPAGLRLRSANGTRRPRARRRRRRVVARGDAGSFRAAPGEIVTLEALRAATATTTCGSAADGRPRSDVASAAPRARRMRAAARTRRAPSRECASGGPSRSR